MIKEKKKSSKENGVLLHVRTVGRWRAVSQAYIIRDCTLLCIYNLYIYIHYIRIIGYRIFAAE